MPLPSRPPATSTNALAPYWRPDPPEPRSARRTGRSERQGDPKQLGRLFTSGNEARRSRPADWLANARARDRPAGALVTRRSTCLNRAGLLSLPRALSSRIAAEGWTGRRRRSGSPPCPCGGAAALRAESQSSSSVSDRPNRVVCLGQSLLSSATNSSTGPQAPGGPWLRERARESWIRC